MSSARQEPHAGDGRAEREFANKGGARGRVMHMLRPAQHSTSLTAPQHSAPRPKWEDPSEVQSPSPLRQPATGTGRDGPQILGLHRRLAVARRGSRAAAPRPSALGAAALAGTVSTWRRQAASDGARLSDGSSGSRGALLLRDATRRRLRSNVSAQVLLGTARRRLPSFPPVSAPPEAASAAAAAASSATSCCCCGA